MVKIIKNELTRLMGGDTEVLIFSSPSIILMSGLQGSKLAFSGKLMNTKNKTKKPL